LEQRVVAALWSLPGVGVKTVQRARAAFPQLTELYRQPVQAWCSAVPFTRQARASLARVDTLEAVADRLEATLARLQYRVIFPEHSAWPPALRNLRDAPPVLFMMGPGAEGPPRRRVALVGTRNPETGSAAEVRRLAMTIAAAGVGVVSGGAEGIDRVAHLGALDAGGETWAFLGCAIEEIDPAQAVLRKAFFEGQGTFFSHFPPGARPDRGTFVQRNHWISGAAEAVVVARAPVKSGALITARAGERQGRPVLVMPGDPWNQAAAGSNALLRTGARPCLSVSDILAALDLDSALAMPRPPIERTRTSISPMAERVMSALTRLPQEFDALLGQLEGMSAGELTAALLELELAGEVLQRAGKRYERVA
jgi:DNA processing protein